MEQEIRNLKILYEREIAKLRSEIQSTSSDIAKSELKQSKLVKSSADIRDR